MNKKIILSLGASALLASSLFACGGNWDMKQGCKSKGGYHKMMKKGGHHKKDGKIMKMVMMLDLSDKQRVQIKSIIKDGMKNIPNPYSAFSDTSFDKDKFIKLSKGKRDAKIEKRAEVISQIYAVLNPSQKKDLKTMLDMRALMKKKMMGKGNYNGKNCNGRR